MNASDIETRDGDNVSDALRDALHYTQPVIDTGSRGTTKQR